MGQGTVLSGSRTFSSNVAGGERMVLVHGSMDRQAGFLKLAKVLSSEHQVTVYDRRGYASSRDMEGPFDIGAQVGDLLDVIGTDPAILIGHSFGGTVAMACAQYHPERVRGLVIYENPMPWLPWWPRNTGAATAASQVDDPEGAAERFLIRFIGQRLWDRLPETTKQLRRDEGRALVGELTAIHAAQAFSRDHISQPMIIGVGSLSSDHMRKGAEYLAEKPDSKLVVLEGAHHNAHSSMPLKFSVELVEPLVQRLRRGTWK